MGTDLRPYRLSPSELVRLADLPDLYFFEMGGWGAVLLNLNQRAEEGNMGKKHRKRYKPLLSRFEQAIAVLDRHTFDNEDLEETRQSLVRQYITRDELSNRQKQLVFKIAAPITMKAKRVRTERKKRKHFVYAINDGHNVKIGYAVNPRKRLADLQVASPSLLKLESQIECENSATARKVERDLHRACRRFHIRGEWFEPEAMVAFDRRLNQA